MIQNSIPYYYAIGGIHWNCLTHQEYFDHKIEKIDVACFIETVPLSHNKGYILNQPYEAQKLFFAMIILLIVNI